MKITIYHNPRCSKSRQTLQLIEASGSDVNVIEYLKTPPDVATLQSVLDMLGIRARDLLRTSEPEYDALGLADPQLGDDELIKAMVSHPKLIQRPIVIGNGKAVIGRPPERVMTLLEPS